MALEETKKGPWTEEEDMKLVCFVSLFGERRWDFIAKVSGLNRTGKSCRLRWVNYLHPGLKRGKMTPQEERLVVELHSKWGNRWSRIARKLPGRTDNEIKNCWRTHMRKKAQEMRRRNLMFSSSSSLSSLCNIDSSSSMSLLAATDASMDSFPYGLHYIKSDQSIEKKNKGDGGASSAAHLVNGPGEYEHKEEDAFKAYPMEQIWKEIASTEMVNGSLLDENFRFDGGTFPMDIPSPIWDYQSYEEFEYPVWKMNEEELNLWFPIDAHVFNYQHEGDNKSLISA